MTRTDIILTGVAVWAVLVVLILVIFHRLPK